MAPIRDILINLRSGKGLSRRDGVAFDPMDCDGLRVSCQCQWPGDISDWKKLFQTDQNATIFQSPIWQMASWKAGRVRGRLRFIQVHRQNELLMALPMVLDHVGVLQSAGNSMSDYLHPLIISDSIAESCWRAILTFIKQHWDEHVHGFSIHNIRADHLARNILASISETHGFAFGEMIAEQTPILLLPETFDAYLASLDAHERKELRRKINKAQTKAAAVLERIESTDQAVAALPAAIAMMQNAGGDKALAITGYIKPLLEAIGPDLIQANLLEIHTLKLQNQIACYMLQCPAHQSRMLYNIGVDMNQKEFSPGVVAAGLSIQQAIERREKTFDFLRGNEPYKYRLGAVNRALYRINLQKK